MSLSASMAALAACAGLLGVAGGAMWPNIEAELARGRQGPSLRRRLSVFNVTWSLGTLAGPLLSGWLYPPESVVYSAAGRDAINRVFFVSAGLAVAMAVLLAAWRPHIPSVEGSCGVEEEPPHDPGLLRAFLRMSYVANLLCYVVLGVLRQLYEALADHLWHGSGPAQIHSGLLAVLAAASTATFAVLAVAHRWPCRIRRFVLFQILMVAGLALIAGTSAVWLAAAGFAMVGVAAGFFYSGSIYYSLQGRQGARHLAGWHEAVIGLGKLGGILLGLAPALLARLGMRSEEFLVRSPYVVLVCLAVAASCVQLCIYRRSRLRGGSSVPLPR